MADSTKVQEDHARLVERDYESYELLLGLWQADPASVYTDVLPKAGCEPTSRDVVGAYHLYYLHNARGRDGHQHYSPSLQPQVAAFVADVYPTARADACDETGLPETTFPQACPWTTEQILDDAFWATVPRWPKNGWSQSRCPHLNHSAVFFMPLTLGGMVSPLPVSAPASGLVLPAR